MPSTSPPPGAGSVSNSSPQRNRANRCFAFPVSRWCPFRRHSKPPWGLNRRNVVPVTTDRITKPLVRVAARAKLPSMSIDRICHSGILPFLYLEIRHGKSGGLGVLGSDGSLGKWLQHLFQHDRPKASA